MALEKNFKKREQQKLEKDGWVFLQLVAGAGIPEGTPDTLALSPTGRAYFIEWKKSKNASKRPLQDYWVNKLNEMGHHATFAHPDNWQRIREYMLERERDGRAE